MKERALDRGSHARGKGYVLHTKIRPKAQGILKFNEFPKAKIEFLTQDE